MTPNTRIALMLIAATASCLLSNYPPLGWLWWFAGMFGVLHNAIEAQEEGLKSS